MTSPELPRSVLSAGILLQLGREHGVHERVLLDGTGIDPRLLSDLDGEISGRQELTMIENLVRSLGDPAGLGIVAGVRYHLTVFGWWGFAIISSATPRRAIEAALNYLELTYSYCSATLRDDERGAKVVFEPDAVPEPVRRFVVERSVGALCTVAAEAFPHLLLVQGISLAFPGAAQPVGADAVPVKPRYRQAQSMVALDAGAMSRALPQANEHSAAMALRQCERLLQQRRARQGIAGEVRRLLTARLATPISVSDIANTMNMSTRTLQRRLAAEGTTPRDLLNEVREYAADELLLTAGLSVADVAERLGYTELSSFSQAFRRWKGTSPQEHRSRRARSWRIPGT